ncbi:NAD(P)H-dependent flavin oxidoreductase [Microbacterium sp. JB110]|uniref:NAD(P)H-dependent flavin oxidoreductase n=1 Tax=Microbacterium sp. JB110 TaxID=2024477 RepID=UPI00097EEC98|nr:nitronate monooxygenase [Microbacterium sp. JB110]RCS60815.1 nitronate monooxygenase [Microbacterium sp. JB110]SJM64588.1 oxidoreductase [Frigoribacterium sp. JB110]
MPILDSRLPLAAAPMAGGPSTIALARAVAQAGGFPFLAGGYQSPDALAEQIAQARSIGSDFGVNLFASASAEIDDDAFEAFVDEIAEEAARYDIVLSPEPVSDDDQLGDKVAMLVEMPVPVVSFTFGLPGASALRALQSVGTTVLATVTTPDEARQAVDSGVNGLVVQGSSAGGHSATFDPTHDPRPLDTAELVRRVKHEIEAPVIAAGGVDGPDAVARLLEAGAEAVSVGTLLLRTDEAGTSVAHRRALADPDFTETAITRVFTGRPARALRNGFINRHHSAQITAYPAVHHLTRSLRRAAAAEGDTDRLHLWAGTGWRSARADSAVNVIRWLAGDE